MKIIERKYAVKGWPIHLKNATADHVQITNISNQQKIKLTNAHDVSNEPSVYVLGDLHGNVVKLIAFLASIGVITITQQGLTLRYRLYRTEATTQDTIPPLPERRDRAYSSFKTIIIDHVTWPANIFNTKLVFLGDTLCDRGFSDAWTLYIFKAMQVNNVIYKITLSNHDSWPLGCYLTGDYEKEPRLNPNESWDYKFLNEANKLEFKHNYTTGYLLNLCLLGYDIIDDDIIDDDPSFLYAVYSHTRFSKTNVLELIRRLSDLLGIPHDRDIERDELHDQIDRVNELFSSIMPGNQLPQATKNLLAGEITKSDTVIGKFVWKRTRADKAEVPAVLSRGNIPGKPHEPAITETQDYYERLQIDWTDNAINWTNFYGHEGGAAHVLNKGANTKTFKTEINLEDWASEIDLPARNDRFNEEIRDIESRHHINLDNELGKSISADPRLDLDYPMLVCKVKPSLKALQTTVNAQLVEAITTATAKYRYWYENDKSIGFWKHGDSGQDKAAQVSVLARQEGTDPFGVLSDFANNRINVGFFSRGKINTNDHSFISFLCNAMKRYPLVIARIKGQADEQAFRSQFIIRDFTLDGPGTLALRTQVLTNLRAMPHIQQPRILPHR